MPRRACLVVALGLYMVASLGAQDEGAPAWLSGTWVGQGYQPGSDAHFTIELICDATTRAFAISYPSLGCSGTWELVSQADGVARFVETITEGTDACVDGGKVVLTQISDQFVTWSFFYPDDETLDSFSTLHKE